MVISFYPRIWPRKICYAWNTTRLTRYEVVDSTAVMADIEGL
jgi:hypothetical protein